MAYKFRDLIVTVVPRGMNDGDGSGSGGCAACSDAGSGSVGSCTSECGVQCMDSGEVMDLTPYAVIDPAYQLELRQLLVYALRTSGVEPPVARPIKELEEQMRPRTIGELEVLEKQLTGALHELREEKRRLGKQTN